jgi:hypothetical protein
LGGVTDTDESASWKIGGEVKQFLKGAEKTLFCKKTSSYGIEKNYLYIPS